MAKQAKEDLDIREDAKLTVLADKGYYTGSEIKECHDNGIETIVSPKKNANDKKDERFQKRNFTYNEIGDVYVCPEGHELKINGRYLTRIIVITLASSPSSLTYAWSLTIRPFSF